MNRIIILLIVALVFSCNDAKENAEELNALQTEVDSLETIIKERPKATKEQIITFLTFQNNDAEEAMNFYVNIFENSKITEVRRYGKDVPAPEGSILMARFELNGSQFACSDSYIKHEWDFTPGVSNFIDCKSNEELESLFAKLSEKGSVLMPLANYGWSEKFGFVVDQFGVSWQLNL